MRSYLLNRIQKKSPAVGPEIHIGRGFPICIVVSARWPAERFYGLLRLKDRPF